jgi:hypothetical protein
LKALSITSFPQFQPLFFWKYLGSSYFSFGMGYEINEINE